MVTEITMERIRETVVIPTARPRVSPAGKMRVSWVTPCPIQAEAGKLLILVEIEHVHHVAFAVDQEHPATVNNALQVVRQLGQLVFTSERHGLRGVLDFSRQHSAAANLAL